MVGRPWLLGPLLLLGAAGSPPQCGEGEVRDLDGSCVKKFVPPPRKSRCPDPVIDNGNSFIMGRIVEFFCDTDHVRVPDTEKAICKVTGQWSKQVPVCLKPGCQAPGLPPSGHLSLSHSSTLATFSCAPGHLLTGPATLACIDGSKWNGTAPACERLTTPAPSLPAVSTSPALLPAITTLLLAILPGFAVGRW